MVGASMGNDQYCLRWNSYETNILATFEGLLDSEALSDVTLFCEGESFKAHRLVLAACSTHFAKLFGSSPLNGQIIVILDGTRSQDLQILLQFMYRGVAYLHQDRIDSVLRTAEVLQVKGLSDGHTVENVTNDGKPPSREEGAAYMSPPREPLKKDQEEGIDREIDLPQERAASPRPSGPSGRIAAADSPLPHQRSPIFQGSQGANNYPRPPFTSIASTFYQQFAANSGGFARPDNKPTSTSFGAPTKSELPSQGPQSQPSSQYLNFNPIQREERERDREGHYEGGPGLNIREADRESPSLAKRSPPQTHRRPSSAEYEQRSPRLIQSDSTTDAPGTSPSNAPRPPYPEETENRNRHGDHVNIKTESNSTEDVSPRPGSFSGGDFQGSRGEERRITPITTGTTGTGRADDMPMNLRTNDQEERLKRETNLETLRRIAAANTANSERENQLATIQKMDLLRQANQGRDPFLGGNFQIPLTAPLGIPASDLARIACSVQDPSCTGTNSSGKSGTKLKCPFCERTYGYETNLRAHIRQRHQGIRVPCPFCHRSFTRNNTVRRHIAREHRHQINPKMIPAKFGSTKVLPDAPFQEHLNKHAGAHAGPP